VLVLALAVGGLPLLAPAPAGSQTGYGPIVAAHSSKVMDVLGALVTPTRIVQWADHGGANQRWRLVPFSTIGPFQLVIIQSELSKLVLDVGSGETTTGAALVQNTWTAAPSQVWIVHPIGATGYHVIINVKSGKVADVSRSSLDNGVQIVQWDWNGGLNQIWKVPAPVADPVPVTTVTTAAPAECSPLQELLGGLLGAGCTS
jgi:hypothetical protein